MRRHAIESRSSRRRRYLALGPVWLLAAVTVLFSCRPEPTHESASATEAAPAFVGTATCQECHTDAWKAWRGSDHDLAMMPATPESVSGDFADATFSHRGVTSRFYRRDGRYFVFTEGPGGVAGEFEITYTFGVRPLQQYLVPLPGGRLQALSIAWDTVGKRWFHLYPDREIAPSDWLHWTRNGQNWNGMCAECHSTNLRKNYDPDSATFATTWSEVNVGCEACHGPSSRHLEWAKQEPDRRSAVDLGLPVATSGISARRQVEICAACHSRRAELGDYDHTAGDLLDQFRPSLLDEGLYESDGQQLDEVYTWGSFVQSRMYARGMQCGDCHDPHAANLRAPGNAACVRCHNPAGSELREGIDGSGLLRKSYDSPEHHFHRVGAVGSACVDCHAPPRDYMVVDPRHDHSFRIPRPDLTLRSGAPNACNDCHADRSAAWAAAAVERWYGPGRRREAHYGETFAAARAGKPGAIEPLRALAVDMTLPAIVRATAVDLLARNSGEATNEVQRAALGDPDPMVREAAAGSIQIADPSARLAALGPLLSDPVRAVRLAAVSALAGTPEALLASAYRAVFDGALADYVETMRYSLDFAGSGLNLGNLYSALGRPAEAERYYRSALAVDDLFYPAKANLAVLLSGQGRNDEAERLLREILSAYPGNADTASSLGLLLVETGRPEEAVDWLRRAVESASGPTRASYNLGLLLAQLGRVDDARTTLSRALAREPTNWDLLFALADLELRSGRPREALALAERMLAERPGDPTGAQLRGAARQALSR